MALGPKFDLLGPYSIVKGLPWSLEFTRKAGPAKTPVDLTGCSARLVITDLLADAAPETPLEFTTLSGHIVLGGALGTVAIDLDETDTLLAVERASYRFYFTDSTGRESLLLRGRLGLVEDDEYPVAAP
jgi:hypothetical protein